MNNELNIHHPARDCIVPRASENFWHRHVGVVGLCCSSPVVRRHSENMCKNDGSDSHHELHDEWMDLLVSNVTVTVIS